VENNGTELEAQLIPDRWLGLDGKPVSIDVWLGGIGRYDHAIGYAGLFWPSFVEVEGCVFFGSEKPASFEGFWKQTGGNRKDVETVINHRHICDLFMQAPTANAAQALWLGRKLKEMWAAKLQRDFPHKRFTVFFPEEFDIERDNPAITFCQE
jgi:hypothetical protein